MSKSPCTVHVTQTSSLFPFSWTWGVTGCDFCLILILFLFLKIASAFGDPHFFTFDGLNFTFNGLGEYTLVESDLTSLRVQGRTQQARFSNGKLVREEEEFLNFWDLQNWDLIFVDLHLAAILLSSLVFFFGHLWTVTILKIIRKQTTSSGKTSQSKFNC